LAGEAKRGYVCDMGFGTGAFNAAKRFRPGTIAPQLLPNPKEPDSARPGSAEPVSKGSFRPPARGLT
jgi:hypothetical protein